MHVWGYRNYETRDDSRNNPIIGLLAGGEGWHNNHHADPTSARHGHKWWQFDLSWQTIRVMVLISLATEVALPSPNLVVTCRASASLSDDSSHLQMTGSKRVGRRSVRRMSDVFFFKVL
jgi:hypothetical protein